jgi:hypothetical protein
VLDQSYSKGWLAYCRPARGKERSLGAPIPIDGYANGWRVGPGCRRARFAYAPQRVADIGFGLSALACLLLVAVGAAGALRARRRGARTAAAATSPGGQPPPPDPLIRLRLGHALLAAAATAIVTGGLYALRMGPVIGLLALALVLAGLNVRRLLALASIAIAALPVIYIAFPAKDRGGFSFQYANDQIYAHFIAEAAITCVVVAAAIAAYRLRSSRRESRSSR